MQTITSRQITEDVTIVLGPDATDRNRIRINVQNAEETIYTRSTKFDSDFIGRVERYLHDAGIYRRTAYTNSGEYMLAGGTRKA